MRSRLFAISLSIVLLLQNSTHSVTALRELNPRLSEASNRPKTSALRSELTVNLSTATGKTIVFQPDEKEIKGKADPEENAIPHLVLKENGVPTPGFERTLNVSIGNLPVPPSGMYVQLVIETQHGDPDFGRERNVRIRVRKESRFIPIDELTQQGVQVSFSITFDPFTVLPHKTVKTPTDYYRCRILITDAQGKQLQTYVRDFAFLMENQWRVPLPEVLEATSGAAPDELLIYYYDMMPFQSNLRDPDTQIPRQEVDSYVQTELIPAMAEAFQTQSNVWGFPWYEEWHNSRRDEARKTLSVALGEHGLWFHGKPAPLGHSMISIRVDGAAGEYDSLTDGIMSIFHHELFHNHQRNLSLHYAKHPGFAGKDEVWMMFTEGTAVLASSVGQPVVQFRATAQPRSYLKRANAFLGSESSLNSGLNKSYKEIPYHTALYWRFLYENCGGVTSGGEDPVAGMKVIHQILGTLYKGEIVDINTSTNVAKAFPRILDAALESTPSCKFRSYEESLVHFARAIYLLRLENGRCPSLLEKSQCGLKDPRNLYATPRADLYFVQADQPMEISDSIPSSYGIDLKELKFGSSMDGKTLKMIFTSNPRSNVDFHIEIWRIRVIDESNGTHQQLAQMVEPVSRSIKNGSLILEFENIDSREFNGLGLIITRTDPDEEKETTGDYALHLLAE
jgi:hypothetical protein